MAPFRLDSILVCQVFSFFAQSRLPNLWSIPLLWNTNNFTSIRLFTQDRSPRWSSSEYRRKRLRSLSWRSLLWSTRVKMQRETSSIIVSQVNREKRYGPSRTVLSSIWMHFWGFWDSSMSPSYMIPRRENLVHLRPSFQVFHCLWLHTTHGHRYN